MRPAEPKASTPSLPTTLETIDSTRFLRRWKRFFLRMEQSVGHRDEGAVEAAEVVVGDCAEEGRAEDGDCRTIRDAKSL